jgi:tricorn protease
VDQTRNTGFPLTTDPAQETDPIWSPEGNRIAFVTEREGRFDLRMKYIDGGSDETLLTEDEYIIPLKQYCAVKG